MDNKKLKSIRTSMNLDMVSMAKMLGWPYRTYQDRELGNRGIPEYAANEVLEVQKRNRATMGRIQRKITADLDKRFPTGVPSEIS